MSLVGQVDWNFHVTVCAWLTFGMAMVAALPAAAAARKRRRLGLVLVSVMRSSKELIALAGQADHPALRVTSRSLGCWQVFF
jgi:hypothetical protein